jgi:hypothetical protein
MPLSENERVIIAGAWEGLVNQENKPSLIPTAAQKMWEALPTIDGELDTSVIFIIGVWLMQKIIHLCSSMTIDTERRLIAVAGLL